MDDEYSSIFFLMFFYWGPCFEQSKFVLQKLSLVSSYSRDLSDLRPWWFVSTSEGKKLSSEKKIIFITTLQQPSIWTQNYLNIHKIVRGNNIYFVMYKHTVLHPSQAARILVVLICKHEFDARYQKSEDKLYIAQLYFPLIGQVCALYTSKLAIM